MAISGISRISDSSKYYQQLSSGKKINSAKDDAAGLAISQKMETQIREEQAREQSYKMSQAMSNVADAAYAGMNSYISDLTANEVRQGNELFDSDDMAALTAEAEALTGGAEALQAETVFNEKQVIADGTVDFSSTDAMAASVGFARAVNGAHYNALSHRINNSGISQINTTASLSTISDTEMGEASVNWKKETALERYRAELQHKRQVEQEKRANGLFTTIG
ncbi:MAG: hypothetical protein K6E33_08090 [Lachnospiraceae bacterium]|nr:hypothetical protein [Lachnospiraceae bacterium]